LNYFNLQQLNSIDPFFLELHPPSPPPQGLLLKAVPPGHDACPFSTALRDDFFATISSREHFLVVILSN